MDSSASHPAPCPPPNFSWLEEGVVCACAFPSSPAHLRYLATIGVTYLVSLTAERRVEAGDDQGVSIVHIPIVDYTAPAMAQIEEFLYWVQRAKNKGQAVCVHCAHGLGRTGTLLACYCIQSHRMRSDDAIEHVRKLRPGSIETSEQELVVHEFSQHWNRRVAAGKAELVLGGQEEEEEEEEEDQMVEPTGSRSRVKDEL